MTQDHNSRLLFSTSFTIQCAISKSLAKEYESLTLNLGDLGTSAVIGLK